MKIEICRKIDSLGRLVIPADLRRQYGLKSGDKVWFSVCDEGIIICLEDCINNNDKSKEK